MFRTPSHFTRVLSVFVAVAGLAFAFPTLAQNGCPAFPRISLWGDMTHASVRQYVDDKLGGDWGAYLTQLQSQQQSLLRLQKRGAGVEIKRQGRKIKLAGEQLDKYVGFSKQRLAVVKCLAEKIRAEKLNGFSTAAGTPENSINSKTALPRESDMQRTYITIPKDLLAKLRKRAISQSINEASKKSVSDVVVEILEKELTKRPR